ncbi:UNVERIFIED_CONTAM: hypothetical protein K2H54_060164 [Gekko kuhli]
MANTHTPHLDSTGIKLGFEEWLLKQLSNLTIHVFQGKKKTDDIPGGSTGRQGLFLVCGWLASKEDETGQQQGKMKMKRQMVQGKRIYNDCITPTLFICCFISGNLPK